MKPQWQTKLTLPPKDEPYTQEDCDAVIGLPVNLNMGVQIGQRTEPLGMVGTITGAEIQPDGSAVITMEVTSA